MREIQLTKGYVAQVDDEDYERVNQFKWYANEDKRKGKIYNVYATRFYKRTAYKMHRVILGVTDPKIKVDHEDHNGLNNQRYNLRVATHAENQHNRRLNSNNASGYKGVCWDEEAKKWHAQIGYEGKQQSLGLFTNAEHAALVYDLAAKKTTQRIRIYQYNGGSRSRSMKEELTMEVTKPSSEYLIRSLWSDRFSPLVFPEDFLAQWLRRSASEIHYAFDSIQEFYEQHPEKSELDLARMLTAEISRNARSKFGHQLLKGAIKESVVTADNVNALWTLHFPDLALPVDFLNKWMLNKRSYGVVRNAFENAQRIRLTNPDTAFTTDDLCRIVTADMRRLTEQAARKRIAEYKVSA